MRLKLDVYMTKSQPAYMFAYYSRKVRLEIKFKNIFVLFYQIKKKLFAQHFVLNC